MGLALGQEAANTVGPSSFPKVQGMPMGTIRRCLLCEACAAAAEDKGCGAAPEAVGNHFLSHCSPKEANAAVTLKPEPDLNLLKGREGYL